MAALGWSVQAGEKSKEACLRRHCRRRPQSLADEAGQGDGGVVVFQRARQIGGVRAADGLWRLTIGGQCSRCRAVVTVKAVRCWGYAGRAGIKLHCQPQTLVCSSALAAWAVTMVGELASFGLCGPMNS